MICCVAATKCALRRRREVPPQRHMLGVDKFIAMHAFPIMPGMRELVVKLLTSGKQVFLVSGGFRRIYANNIMFDEEGKYAGFDDTEPTSRSGGKAEAVKRIKASNGFQTVVMVGDGMTDLEARVEGGADANSRMT